MKYHNKNQLIIGVDLDNTIIDYHDLFYTTALEKNLIPITCGRDKNSVKNYLIKLDQTEQTWMSLQSLVYGDRIKHAKVMTGFYNFAKRAKDNNHIIHIVSHKTQFGHFDVVSINLREAANKWLKMNSIITGSQFLCAQSTIHYAATRSEKIAIIKQLKCDCFVDDLPEVLLANDFPIDTDQIWFNPQKNVIKNENFDYQGDWEQITQYLIETVVDYN